MYSIGHVVILSNHSWIQGSHNRLPRATISSCRTTKRATKSFAICLYINDNQNVLWGNLNLILINIPKSFALCLYICDVGQPEWLVGQPPPPVAPQGSQKFCYMSLHLWCWATRMAYRATSIWYWLPNGATGFQNECETLLNQWK